MRANTQLDTSTVTSIGGKAIFGWQAPDVAAIAHTNATAAQLEEQRRQCQSLLNGETTLQKQRRWTKSASNPLNPGAARLDGARPHQIWWHVILPAMRPILEFVAVVTNIGMLTSMFGLIYVLTAGGPGTATTLPEFLIWMDQGKMKRPGYASAISMVLFVMMAGLAYVHIRIMSRNANP